jgi:predicted flap endonuclease-1-like 5' DNA nuclease
MLYLLQALPAWWIAALGLGLFFGFLSGKPSQAQPSSWTAALPFALGPLVAGAVVVWMRWLPGRYGLWFETALLLLAAYLLGCVSGCLMRRIFPGAMAAKAAPSVRLEQAKSVTAKAAPPARRVLPEPAPLPSETRKVVAIAEMRQASPAPAAPPDFAPPGERAGEKDDFGLIQGIDPKTARGLHELGVWRFSQIAAWAPEQQQWIGEKLDHGGPLVRLYWIAQARLLAGGVATEFSRATGQGDARRATTEAPLDEAAAEYLLAGLPQVITPHANDEIYAGLRPLSLLQPPYGEKDDLSRISGVDPAIARRLNALGVWTYAQIARWSEENARWIGSYLAFPGRVEAENWVGQARVLADEA